jgi:ribulose-5-phosphate 4-epimerase/fuculose-1-phosphate aldolase
MNEIGGVKFNYESVGGELVSFPGFEELNAARQKLRQQGLLGLDENGIGFGNVSVRDGATSSFYITGSGTGGAPELRLHDYAKVIAWDFERNWLRCEGRAIASAESLTHAAVYSTDTELRVVLHGHGAHLWRKLRQRGFATDEDVAYGTAEMTREVERLFRETDVRGRNIFAMGGHTDGIVAFGRNLTEAMGVIEILPDFTSLC